MKRFKFRLQALLDQRERLEQAAQQSYALAQQAVAQGQIELEQSRLLASHLLASMTQLRDSLVVDPQEQIAYQTYVKEIKRRISAQERAVSELVAKAEVKRLLLVSASLDRKVIVKLKEKQVAEYAQLEINNEQLQNDELAGVRHGHRQELDQAA